MKYWIDTLQYTGIALLAGAVITDPLPGFAIFGGMWLIITGFLLSLLVGGNHE